MFARLLVLVATLMSTSSVYAQIRAAQGVMVKFSGLDNLAVISNQVYAFDAQAAAQYYSIEGIGYSLSCTGATGCSSTNQPPVPTPPTPNQSLKVTFAENQKCVFLTGGSLTQTSIFQIAVTLPGLNGSGTWRYNFGYVIAPNIAFAEPLTAWNFVSSSSTGDALASISASVAAQSVLQVGKSKAYSFLIDRNDGSARIRNLQLFINGSLVGQPTASVQRNVDFEFSANAGAIGTTSLLQIGDARTILNTDSVSTNNNGGSTGRQLAMASTSPVNVLLGPGTFAVKLKGKVLAVDSIAEQNFEVTETLEVLGQGCNL